jgi:hypothetical protein
MEKTLQKCFFPNFWCLLRQNGKYIIKLSEFLKTEKLGRIFFANVASVAMGMGVQGWSGSSVVAKL